MSMLATHQICLVLGKSMHPMNAAEAISQEERFAPKRADGNGYRI